MNVVVSGEVRSGLGNVCGGIATAMSGMGAGVGAATGGNATVGVYGVVGETGYSNAEFEEIEIRNRGRCGRSE